MDCTEIHVISSVLYKLWEETGSYLIEWEYIQNNAAHVKGRHQVLALSELTDRM